MLNAGIDALASIGAIWPACLVICCIILLLVVLVFRGIFQLFFKTTKRWNYALADALVQAVSTLADKVVKTEHTLLQRHVRLEKKIDEVQEGLSQMIKSLSAINAKLKNLEDKDY